MSDDMWRKGSGSGQDDEFEDFGELRFADDEGDEEPAPLSFGDNDTGSLPHWTEILLPNQFRTGLRIVQGSARSGPTQGR